MNIYLISQHSLGVGSLSRATILSAELAKIPGSTVYHISCGPSTDIVSRPPAIRFIELPPLVVKDLGCNQLVPAEAGKTKEDVEKERVAAIETLLQHNPPDVFITDLYPFSPQRLDGTVRPVLREIKRRYPRCRIICSCKDIPVCQGEKLSENHTRHVHSLISTYYDLVLVHSDPDILKLSDVDCYRDLKLSCPVFYTGYITKKAPSGRRSTARPSRHNIVVTVGGGRDGDVVIDGALKAARLGTDYGFDIVCGPFMDKERVDAFRSKALGLPNVDIHDYVRDLRNRFVKYDLVVCAGGYNTLLETLESGTKCISIARKASYAQKKRVAAFSKRGLVWSLAETSLNGKSLSRLIGEALAAEQKTFRLNSNGLKATGAILKFYLASYSPRPHGQPRGARTPLH